MNKIIYGISIVGVVVIAVFLYWHSQQPPPLATEIVALQSAQGAEGFARVTEPRAMQFPADHGPHPAFQTEWWYYTGNLTADNGRRFGYQLTFFRRGITPGDPSTALGTRATDWATNQIYFAHFALTDEQNNSHHETEIFSRGAAGLAGATGEPFRVWIENWAAVASRHAQRTSSRERDDLREELNREASSVKLVADDGTMSLDLNLNATKPPVTHGEKGVSQKTETRGNASYYVSLTRMPTEGTLRVNGETIAVSGTSWFDHEWGTSALGENAVGWDWFSIQLDDAREVMYFQIRNKDGDFGERNRIEALSSGTLVEPDSTTQHLKRDDVEITPREFWTSGYSQASYPSKWRVQSEKGNFDLMLTPLIPDQELRVSFTYWEGAMNVTGTSNGKPVRGQGYVELTGYAAQARGDVGY